MHSQEFRDFFKKATGKEPFPYQIDFAIRSESPDIIDVPTGLGKTAAVVLAWLWKRHKGVSVPRRLVYCLPMRTLVEQVRDDVCRWVENLSTALGRDIEVVTLMGGENTRGWDLYPENEMIVVGTQDMLLSRALNRGYGMSRFRWPLDFGILNNDCLWVMDEVQLMGVGLATSVQLDAFRDMLGHYGRCGTIWMSATVDRSWFETPDAQKGFDIHSLSDRDQEVDLIRKRVEAPKEIVRFEGEDWTEAIVEAGGRGSTLVVLNTVDRAQDLFKRVKRKFDGPCVLLHSRFRPPEREKAYQRVREVEDGGIAICTQVVEAGVDLSVKNLFTELAPWPSMVQRFGRCNRKGEHENSSIVWMDLEERQYPPYEVPAMDSSREVMGGLGSGSIIHLPHRPMVNDVRHVIRRRDIVELFDTTPDVSGNLQDITRFVRDTEDKDVLAFWRDSDNVKDLEPSIPGRDEICRIPIKGMRKFLEKRNKKAYKLDQLDGKWEPLTSSSPLTPNDIVLLGPEEGGYDEEMGFDPGSKKYVPLLSMSVKKGDSLSSENVREDDELETLGQHTLDVLQKVREIGLSIPCDDEALKSLERAALWHDVGKAHPSFQAKLVEEMLPEDGPYAKAPKDAWHASLKAAKGSRQDGLPRRYFRHELVSGVVALQNGEEDAVAYLSASHHGKVRMALRSVPREDEPSDDRLFAKGVWDGDVLPSISLEGLEVPETIIDMSYMVLGDSGNGASWSRRTLRLLERYGPFRLAYLEGILKVADERASGGLE